VKRVHLFGQPGELTTIGGLSVRFLQEASCAIAKFLVNGTEGRGTSPMDPVFEWVTEGRRRQFETALTRGDEWAVKLNKVGGYSACGDMCAAVLWLLGVRDEKLVNRSSDGGTVPWAVGQNLAKLRYNSDFYNFDPSSDVTFDKGDIIYLTGADHVCVAGAGGAKSAVPTYDYGQFQFRANGRVALACENLREASEENGIFRLGSRRVAGWLPLESLKYEESAIVPDDFDGGQEDENPYEEVSKDGKILLVRAGEMPKWVESLRGEAV
jgi:hypothetical protein